jgi:DNA-binding IclR family transcriptional regulator
VLAVREGSEAVFVERIAGSSAVPVLTRVGGRLPITATGVGLVLLAHAPVEIQEEVLAGPIERHTPYGDRPGELRRMLADARATGFAVSDRQLSDETVSVAAPLSDGQRRVVAAVSLVVRYPASIPLLVPPLLTSARAISRAIAGWVPGPRTAAEPG